MTLQQWISTANIADHLDEEKLASIGLEVVEGYEADEDSRTEWQERAGKWMSLALQVVEKKNFPWPQAANIKFPLLTIAALQFNARAYPALLPDHRPVKGEVIGYDQQGIKADAADRISKHMSYQLLRKMESWEEDMDKMTLALPIIGTMFKKTYWDDFDSVPRSEVIYPKDLVVNYFAQSLEDAPRVTHVISMLPNQIKEKQMAKLFLDIDLKDPHDNDLREKENRRDGLQAPDNDSDYDDPFIILEQHSYLDLDEDGYYEPYIITVERASGKVLRITARYSQDDIKYNSDGTLRKIVPINHFTKYSFIPNPDGGFYDLGFGILLGPINETVNTLINQLVDAGTLSNLQSGFLGRGVRIKGGEMRFRPGEWKVINSTGEDLHKNVFAMPVREPSNVLFQLLGLLIESGKQLSSVSDIMTGTNPGQNTKATTAVTTVEQGLKVFNAIYKRIFRALGKEYLKLFKLNQLYLAQDEEFTVLGTQQAAHAGPSDYNMPNLGVLPSADPVIATSEQKAQRAEALMRMLPTGLINPQVAIKRALEAQEQPGIEELMKVSPPPPPPDFQIEQAKLQLEGQKLELEKFKAENLGRLQEAQAAAAVAQAQTAAMSQDMQRMKLQIDTLMGIQQHTTDIAKWQGEQSQKSQDREHQAQLAKSKTSSTPKRN